MTRRRDSLLRALLPLFVLAASLSGGTFTGSPGSRRGSAAAQARAAERVDAAQLLKDVQTLSAAELEGRLTGSAGSRQARALILERFKTLRLQPVNGTYLQPFSFATGRGAGARTFGDAANVMGMVPGTRERDRFVLVTAHYDHLGSRNGQVFHGADDNASGVAAMLQIARWLRANPQPVSVLFVAFEGEEQGLQGAKAFVARPPVDLTRVIAVVNMDMIARGDRNVLFAAGTHHYPALRPVVAAASAGRTITVRFGHDRPGVAGEDDWTHSSDHGPFHGAGVPFVYFGVEDHSDYHKPTDTSDRIPRAFFVEAVDVVLDTVVRLASGETAARAGQRDGGANLSPEELDIVRHVEAGHAAALALLERVVNINSGTMNVDGVRQVGQVFRQELERLGFTARWIDGSSFKRAGHLVADRPGAGPRILLIGHLDTVFEPDSPFQRFERIDDRTARGPGIIDMKGGDVVMVQALKALAAAGALDALHLTVVMTGDEEFSGEPLSTARAALVSAAKGIDVALGFENGPGDPRTAVIARRGTTAWTVRVKAKSGHSSQVFREDIGAGAIYELARILDTFRETLAGEPHLTFNPGVILGGTSVDLEAEGAHGTAAGKENVIAREATVTGDLRTLSVEQRERAEQRMAGIVAASLPHAESTITFHEGYPPLAPAEGNRRLLELYDQASRDVGAGPVTAVDPDRAGAADVSFVAGHAKMILDGIGLMGHSDHSPQETADLGTLASQTKRAAILLYRIGKGAASSR